MKATFFQRRWLVLFVSALLGCAAQIKFPGEFYAKDGAAIGGYDPVAFFTTNQPTRGASDNKAEYKGSTFYFASKENKETFLASPEKYAPQYGGFCAYGMAKGYKAATDPTAFSIVDGKLYLNYNKDIQQQWSADTAGFIAKANQNWPEVSKENKVFE